MGVPVYIGHINLTQSFNGTAEHFLSLVEALDRQGVRQHVIVRNESLARRVSACERVSVGPTTGSPVVACCLAPRVDVVHAHDARSAQTGLLLTLTRSVPFVLTRRDDKAAPGTMVNSVYRRAAGIISTSENTATSLRQSGAALLIDVIPDISRADESEFESQGNRIAAEHLRVYYRAADTAVIPALLL